MLLSSTFNDIDWFTRKQAAYLAFPICCGRAQCSVCVTVICVLCPPPTPPPPFFLQATDVPSVIPLKRLQTRLCSVFSSSERAANIREDTMGTEWPALIVQSRRFFFFFWWGWEMFVPSIHKWIFVRTAGLVNGKWMQTTAVTVHLSSADNEWPQSSK